MADVRYDPDLGEFMGWLKAMAEQGRWVALDTETTGLDPWHDTIRLVQWGSTDRAWVFPYPQRRDFVALALRFCADNLPLVGQNTKFDAQFLTNAGLDASALVDDTKVMGHLLDSGNTTSLKPMADRYLGEGHSDSQTALRDIMATQYGPWYPGKNGAPKRDKIREAWTWATIPQDTFEYWYYAGMDTCLTAELADYLSDRVQVLYGDLYQLEIDVWQALARAERRGLLVDTPYVEKSLEGLRARAEQIQGDYPDVNLGSTQQLAALFADEGIKVPVTDKGNPTLTAAVLNTLDHPIVDDVKEFRHVTKMASTYFQAFLDLQAGGRIHTTINPLGARTGRMSSERPNLQNVPKREEGSFVRRAMLASPGRTLVLADFKQIEYRIFASMSGEPEMVQAFLVGKDMHAVTARMAIGHDPDEHERLIAKNGNFAELYGAGTNKFAATAGITVDAAKRFKAQYHAQFTRIRPFTRAVMKYAQKNGYAVETTFGRRIPVNPDQIYASVNYMVQGSAADVLKRAIQRIAQTRWDDYFVLPVHDELIFDVPDSLVSAAVKALPGLMEDHETYAVPLTVDVTTAKRWGEAA